MSFVDPVNMTLIIDYDFDSESGKYTSEVEYTIPTDAFGNILPVFRHPQIKFCGQTLAKNWGEPGDKGRYVVQKLEFERFRDLVYETEKAIDFNHMTICKVTADNRGLYMPVLDNETKEITWQV